MTTYHADSFLYNYADAYDFILSIVPIQRNYNHHLCCIAKEKHIQLLLTTSCMQLIIIIIANKFHACLLFHHELANHCVVVCVYCWGVATNYFVLCYCPEINFMLPFVITTFLSVNLFNCSHE